MKTAKEVLIGVKEAVETGTTLRLSPVLLGGRWALPAAQVAHRSYTLALTDTSNVDPGRQNETVLVQDTLELVFALLVQANNQWGTVQLAAEQDQQLLTVLGRPGVVPGAEILFSRATRRMRDGYHETRMVWTVRRMTTLEEA